MFPIVPLQQNWNKSFWSYTWTQRPQIVVSSIFHVRPKFKSISDMKSESVVNVGGFGMKLICPLLLLHRSGQVLMVRRFECVYICYHWFIKTWSRWFNADWMGLDQQFSLKFKLKLIIPKNIFFSFPFHFKSKRQAVSCLKRGHCCLLLCVAHVEAENIVTAASKNVANIYLARKTFLWLQLLYPS